ncbi:MAG: UDP-N-acetyl-D-glucosamine 2-epimerase, UDP-hydrolyzing [Bacillales bacterium]|nr:UDP-N-acetyl-D-glucosamine 2-epimerase, UDP-hydrolyzing [Bacillales bacterium]
MKYKICVVTGTRAEYGLLSPLLKEIKDSGFFELQIVVTGMHLSPEFGYTITEIENDGFQIDDQIEILLSSDTSVGTCKSVGLGLISFGETYNRLKPDLIIVLGDRTEIFSAVQAALFSHIPIAHLHGGELSFGAYDDSIRHSITKMSNLHFVAHEEYQNRVIQLGESPEVVFNVGAIGLDNIKKLNLLSKEELETELNFNFGDQTFLVTLHPETNNIENVEDVASNLLAALDNFPDSKVIFTKSNSDEGGRKINTLFEKYCELNKNRAAIFTSLGQLRYLSAIKYVDAVIGNSSSGIIEVPLFKKPTINIGSRQNGRLYSDTIIPTEDGQTEITYAIEKALSSEFLGKIKDTRSLFGEGDTAKKIVGVLKGTDFNKIKLKKFYDLPNK